MEDILYTALISLSLAVWYAALVWITTFYEEE